MYYLVFLIFLIPIGWLFIISENEKAILGSPQPLFSKHFNEHINISSLKDLIISFYLSFKNLNNPTKVSNLNLRIGLHRKMKFSKPRKSAMGSELIRNLEYLKHITAIENTYKNMLQNNSITISKLDELRFIKKDIQLRIIVISDSLNGITN